MVPAPAGSIASLPQLLEPKQVAEALHVTVPTLALWRHHKRYPLPYVKIGRKILYRQDDVAAFMKLRTVAA